MPGLRFITNGSTGTSPVAVGLSTIVGPTGPAYTGPTGPRGFTGPQGLSIIGPTGASFTGPTGPRGFTGPAGLGFTGPTGARGPTGPLYVVPGSDSPFYGWWGAVTKGSVANSYSQGGGWNYMFVNTVSNPKYAQFYYGGVTHPGEYQSFSVNLIEQSSSTLIDENSVYGNNSYQITKYSLFLSGMALQLQSLDNSYILITADCQDIFDLGSGGAMQLFKKLSYDPLSKIRPYSDAETTFEPLVQDPINLWNYLGDLYTNEFVGGTNTYTKDTATLDYYPSRNVWKSYLNESGITYTTPITNVMRSYSGSSGTTNMTNIVTSEISYVYPGASITIYGFSGTWSALNGYYPNNVSVYESRNHTLHSSSHIDWEYTGGNYTGTMTQCLNSFLLNVDTHTLAANSNGYGLYTGSPYVTVNYRVNSEMSYNTFVASLASAMNKTLGTQTHNSFYSRVQSLTTGVLPTGWSMSGTFESVGESLIGARFTNRSPQMFYTFLPGWSYNSRLFRNDPFQVESLILNKFYTGGVQISNSIFAPNYRNFIPFNYLTGARNAYWGFDGAAPSSAAQIYWSNYYGKENINLIGVIGGQTLTATTSPIGINPDGDKWTIIGGSTDGSDESNFYRYFVFGFIKPEYCSGAKVGYMCLPNTLFNDLNSLCYTNLFAPTSLSTPSSKPNREAQVRMWSEVMKYLVSENPKSIIIDYRNNQGGFTTNTYLEFMGGDRNFVYQTFNRIDSGNSVPFNFFDPEFDRFNNMYNDEFNSSYSFYVSQNETNYPGSTFKGTSLNPKKVVGLTSINARSAGDFLTNMLLGENLDKDLGSFTTAKILGSVDGRLNGGFGSIIFPEPFNSSRISTTPLTLFGEIQNNGNFLYISNSVAVTNQNGYNNINPSPTLTGTAGGNPLPDSLDATVYYDFGLVTPHPDPVLGPTQPAISTNNPSTWRDRWLEQAIREARS
jgi:hypothetical protein